MILDKLSQTGKVISRHRRLFILHCWSMASLGFLLMLSFLLYPLLICDKTVASSKIFWIYLIFSSAIFIGSSLTAQIVKHIKPASLLFLCSAICTSSLWLIANSSSTYLLAAVFCFIGMTIGMSHSVTTRSFISSFPQADLPLIHILYMFQSIGMSSATFMFSDTKRESYSSYCYTTPSQHLHHVIGQERFHLNPIFSLNIICFVLATIQLPLMYLLLTTSTKTEEEQPRRENYEDMDPEPNKLPGLKLVLLASIFICTTTVLTTLQPFLVFSHPTGTIIQVQLFAVFFVWGRVVTILISDMIPPFFMLAICIIGCGAACCSWVFEEGLFIGAGLFGLFLSPVTSSLVSYLRFSLGLKLDTLYILLSGSSFGHLLFPLFLCFSAPSENRVVVTFFFFATLLLVLLYVCMLNVQAQIERSKPNQDRLRLFINRFFSGENLLKRTRSIRPFISRIGQNSIRRFRDRRSFRRSGRQAGRIPTIQVSIEPLATAVYSERPSTSCSAIENV